MVHVITWISIAVLALAFIFFIVSIIILEFGVKVGKDGDVVIPWYYWIFFVGSGLLFLAYVILLAFPDKSGDKKKETGSGQLESWVQGDVLYTEYGQKAQIIPGPGIHDPAMLRDQARQVPHYDTNGGRVAPHTHPSSYPPSHSPSYVSHSHHGAGFASHDITDKPPSVRQASRGSSLELLGKRSYLE